MGVQSQINQIIRPAVRAKKSITGKRVDQYVQYYRSEKVIKRTVLYESRDGKSLTDSPLSICLELLQRDVDALMTHIWVVENLESDEFKFFKKRFEKHMNVMFVERNSDDYLKWLARAEYLVNNATFQSFVTIKPEQTYINTWHGTPLKTMGYDIPGNPNLARNVVRNFFMADYLISPNAHTTSMYLDSFRLRHNYQGKILEGGYPRIDATIVMSPSLVLERLKNYGLFIGTEQKIMLYCPTYKGGGPDYAEYELNQMVADIKTLQQRFGREYQILLKVHPFIYEQAKEREDMSAYLIPDGMDTNELLSAVDILITDYSSIFFDFLVTGRPIFFYCWDDDLYSNDRGKYFEYDELPGPVSFSIAELCHQLTQLSVSIDEYKWNYERFKRLYTSYEDGQTTKRYVDYIFFNEMDQPQIKVIEQDKEKKRILLYPGGLRKNGITSSVQNLLSNINFDEYAVTCLLDDSLLDEQVEALKSLPKEVSLLYRFGLPLYTMHEAYKDMYYQNNGVSKRKRSDYPIHLYKRELRRLIGGMVFDDAIDFSGYSLYWSKLILASNSSQKICYLHSDMIEDMNRSVNGRKAHYRNVKGIISVYHRYDRLVSVSPVLKDINREKLADYAEAHRFTYAENLLQPDAILNPKEPEKPRSVLSTETVLKNGILQETSQAISVYNTRPDSRYAKKVVRSFDLKGVIVLGRVEYQGRSYSKISQNYRYVGWISSDAIILSEDSVSETKKEEFFGQLDTGPASQLYTAPIGLPKSQPMTSLATYRNVYVMAEEKAVTQSGESYSIKVNGQKIGWVKSTEIKPSSAFGTLPTGIKAPFVKLGRYMLHRKTRSVSKELLKYSRITEYFSGYVKSSEQLTVYKEPNAKSQTYLIPPETLISLIHSEVVSAIEWLCVKLWDDELWYIQKADLKYRVLTQPEIISRELVSYQGRATLPQLELYATELDVLAGKGMLSRLPESFEVLEVIHTTEGRSYARFLLPNNRMAWVDTTHLERDGVDGVENAAGEYHLFPKRHETTFVTVGRLSSEKNQALLIQAFKLYRENLKQGHLYIIGEGPERQALETLIADLELQDDVTLVGQLSQPYTFMAKCDVFVLTSDYEGQSLVILEALTLGMTVVSRDIPACRKVLEDGYYGLIAQGHTERDIAQAMVDATIQQHTYPAFDASAYNKRALEQFEELL